MIQARTMQHISPSAVFYLVLLLALCTIQAWAAKDTNERAFNKPTTKKSGKIPRFSFDFGSFTFDAFFMEQKLEDRLRLSKSYIKYDMTSKSFPLKEPLMTVKATRIEELINCQNLTTLIKPDRVELIDCKPLEAHTLDESFVSPVGDASSTTSYVRRSSYRAKRKSIITERGSQFDLLLYPFRPDVVRRNIESYIVANNLGDLNFVASNLNLGYHIHFDSESRVGQSPVGCSGDVYLSINRTEPFVRYSNDPYPEYADELSYLMEQAQNNGYLISIQNLVCGRPDIEQLISIKLDTEFTIMQRKQFPYLYIRHKTVAVPHEVLLSYDANVTQVLAPELGTNESYNTTVKISASSGLFDMFNFKLDQTFANKDLDAGFEHMLFINTYLPLRVDSVWSKDKFFKALSIFSNKINEKKTLETLLIIGYMSDMTLDDASITLHLDFKKAMLSKFSWQDLFDSTGLNESIEYEMTPENDIAMALREEL